MAIGRPRQFTPDPDSERMKSPDMPVMDQTIPEVRLEGARRLLSELKAAYDVLSGCYRQAVREALVEQATEPKLAA
jgi:hypothetical protein